MEKHAVGAVPKCNCKIVVEIGQIYARNKHIHNRSFSWLGTGTSMKTMQTLW